MAGINKVILIGNLGRDPDLRYTQGGTAMCRLSVATARSFFDKRKNERVEETEWHRVTVWGKQAEHCEQHLNKGRQVYVEGRLRTSSYEDKDGSKRYSTEIVADTVQFLGGRGGGESDSGERRSSGRGGEGESAGNGGHGYDNYIPEPADDDIPF